VSREPIRLVVVQLARLGDTIQSLMALRAAQQLYPELEITFVAHESFAAAAERCPWIHRVVPFPTQEFVKPMLSGRRGARALVPDIAGWVEPLVERTHDIVLNWTFSDASSFLSRIIPARIRLGYSRKRDGELAIQDGWSHYVHSVVQSDTTQSIHLTDILTTQLLTALQVHFGEPQEDAGAKTVTSKSFFEIRRSPFVCDGWNHPGLRWLAIQLGASQEGKTWPVEDWAKLASMVLRRHDDVRIIVLGGKTEKKLEEAFFESLRAIERKEGRASSLFEKRIHSKVGKTTFDGWAQILGDAQWVVSADTAAIHLASVLGTRVLNVSVGAVRFRETGPYGNGHYVVRGEGLSAEAVYAAWTYAATEWQHRRELPLAEHFANLGSSGELAKADVLRSKIRPADAGGGIHYESLRPQPITLENWCSQVLGHIAREWYCGWVPPVGQDLERSEVHPDLIQGLRKLSEGVEVLDKIYLEAVRSAEELQRVTKSMKSEAIMKLSDRQRIHDLGKKLEELEGLSERVGGAQEPLQPIHRLSKVLMHNLTGKKVAEVAEETAGVYRFLRIGLTGLRTWTDHTLKLAKPVAVASSDAPVIPLGKRREERTPTA
jgi:ADP-heptose:LPS heptosyltransferase